jgi:hypothetical protein
LDFFNLPFLAQKLLGRKIKAYKDIVPKEKTFLELPFEEMKEHACTDADIALQLHTFLEKELKDRKIDQEFEERTMPLVRRLLNLEKDGVPVDGRRLEQLRSRLVDGMLEAKKRVSDGIGSEIDLDSQKEISTLIKEKLGLRAALGRQSLNQSLLEHIAFRQPLLKVVVQYKRSGKQLRRVESIIKAIRRGRVYPLFSHTRERDGRISSNDPDLFADDGLEGLRDSVGGESAVWLQDRRRSLDLAQQASGDLALKKDRTGPGQINLFNEGPDNHEWHRPRRSAAEGSDRRVIAPAFDSLPRGSTHGQRDCSRLGDQVSEGFPLRRGFKSARVEARVCRTGRHAPIFRWFREFEHLEAKHGTSICLSMVSGVLSVVRIFWSGTPRNSLSGPSCR